MPWECAWLVGRVWNPVWTWPVSPFSQSISRKIYFPGRVSHGTGIFQFAPFRKYNLVAVGNEQASEKESPEIMIARGSPCFIFRHFSLQDLAKCLENRGCSELSALLSSHTQVYHWQIKWIYVAMPTCTSAPSWMKQTWESSIKACIKLILGSGVPEIMKSEWSTPIISELSLVLLGRSNLFAPLAVEAGQSCQTWRELAEGSWEVVMVVFFLTTWSDLDSPWWHTPGHVCEGISRKVELNWKYASQKVEGGVQTAENETMG